jgi:hypothetical protein
VQEKKRKKVRMSVQEKKDTTKKPSSSSHKVSALQWQVLKLKTFLYLDLELLI